MGRRGWGRSRYDSYGGYGGYGGFAPYVSVAERKAKAAAHAKRLEKQTGRKLEPVVIEGRTIAKSFWGKAWCDNLESYSDFANRLPRGKTYARNGSVMDLQVAAGKVTALVSGSDIYELSINIETLDTKLWRKIQGDCARSISSLVDLLQGRFDRGVMDRLTRRDDGLFPKPKEISMKCSCPDYAGLCKHLAAVMYGVGARLDHSPELLFTLRNVDHLELIGQAVTAENLDHALGGQSDSELVDSDLSQMFGIELESLDSADQNSPRTKPKRSAKKPAVAIKAAKKKTKATAKGAKSVHADKKQVGKVGTSVRAQIGRPVKTAKRRTDLPKAAAPSHKKQVQRGAEASATKSRRRAAK